MNFTELLKDILPIDLNICLIWKFFIKLFKKKIYFNFNKFKINLKSLSTTLTSNLYSFFQFTLTNSINSAHCLLVFLPLGLTNFIPSSFILLLNIWEILCHISLFVFLLFLVEPHPSFILLNYICINLSVFSLLNRVSCVENNLILRKIDFIILIILMEQVFWLECLTPLFKSHLLIGSFFQALPRYLLVSLLGTKFLEGWDLFVCSSLSVD